MEVNEAVSGGPPAYSAAKTALYTFFLHRASLTQGMLKVFPDFVFKKFLPVYLGDLPV